jgi:hypothetical protein
MMMFRGGKPPLTEGVFGERRQSHRSRRTPDLDVGHDEPQEHVGLGPNRLVWGLSPDVARHDTAAGSFAGVTFVPRV